MCLRFLFHKILSSMVVLFFVSFSGKISFSLSHTYFHALLFHQLNTMETCDYSWEKKKKNGLNKSFNWVTCVGLSPQQLKFISIIQTNPLVIQNIWLPTAVWERNTTLIHSDSTSYERKGCSSGIKTKSIVRFTQTEATFASITMLNAHFKTKYCVQTGTEE